MQVAVVYVATAGDDDDVEGEGGTVICVWRGRDGGVVFLVLLSCDGEDTPR